MEKDQVLIGYDDPAESKYWHISNSPEKYVKTPESRYSMMKSKRHQLDRMLK
jgi:hypothetical protein